MSRLAGREHSPTVICQVVDVCIHILTGSEKGTDLSLRDQKKTKCLGKISRNTKNESESFISIIKVIMESFHIPHETVHQTFRTVSHSASRHEVKILGDKIYVKWIRTVLFYIVRLIFEWWNIIVQMRMTIQKSPSPPKFPFILLNQVLVALVCD